MCPRWQCQGLLCAVTALAGPPASRHTLWEEPYGEIGPLPTKRVGLLLFFYMVFFRLLFEGFGLFSLGCFPSVHEKKKKKYQAGLFFFSLLIYLSYDFGGVWAL